MKEPFSTNTAPYVGIGYMVVIQSTEDYYLNFSNKTKTVCGEIAHFFVVPLLQNIQFRHISVLL